MKPFSIGATCLLFLGAAFGGLRAAEPAAYLGVMTAIAPRGTESTGAAGPGLLVVAVQPDSPAAPILKPNDLLVRLDDQKLFDVNQFMLLVRSYRPGDVVTLTFRRDGQETSARVPLTARDASAIAPTPGASASVGPRSAGASGATGGVTVTGGGVTSIRSSSDGEGMRSIYTDPAGTIEISTGATGKTVVARSADGAVLFSGPFDSEADRAAAPAAARARVEDVERKLAERMSTVSQRLAELRSGRGAGGAGRGGAGGAGAAAATSIRSYATPDGHQIVQTDSQGTLQVTVSAGRKSVMATSTDGAVLYSGPFDSDSERAAAPAAVRARVADLESRTTVSAGSVRPRSP